MLLVVLVKTGRGAVVAAMAAVAGLTLALWAVEYLVETEREQVDRQLRFLAGRLVADDLAAVRAGIEPSSPASAAAERALTEFRVVEARITDMEIKVRGSRTAGEATAKLFAHIQVRPRHGTLDMDRAVRRMEVDLRRRDGRWLVFDYRDRGLDVSDGGANPAR